MADHHHILIRWLKTSHGLSGMVLQWFKTYLVGRHQYVQTGSSASSPALILFLLYTADLILLIEGHGLNPHLYADDTQTYGFCELSASLELQYTIASCVDDVASWMRSNRLQLNTAKSEILWSDTDRHSHQLPQLPLELALTKSRQPLSSVTSAFISTLIPLRGHMSPRSSLPALLYCVSYEVFADLSPDMFSSRW